MLNPSAASVATKVLSFASRRALDELSEARGLLSTSYQSDIIDGLEIKEFEDPESRAAETTNAMGFKVPKAVTPPLQFGSVQSQAFVQGGPPLFSHALLSCVPCDPSQEAVVLPLGNAPANLSEKELKAVERRERIKAFEKVHKKGRRKGKNDPFWCNVPGCDFNSKYMVEMKEHLRKSHNVGIVWYKCEEPMCDFITKWRSSMRSHTQTVHNQDESDWAKCPIDGCEYKAKRRGNMNRHLQYAHKVNNEWLFCPQPGCQYKAMQPAHIRRHLAGIHDIGVQWFPCTECDYKAKRTEHLKRHIEVHHENDLFTEKIDDYIIKRFRKDNVKLLKIAVELREMHSEEPEMVKYFTKNRILNRWMQLRKKGH
ncbi:hypothetical protein TrCOL_g4510 [Triparma columacea]|uniref:C2H2-type domain-containing protein n=1 Tax=Triparma columacea TaxID=722753 RepID=A0A9W7L2C7_9STRA|nr:hypothetical protein TrCOL_g4510 [Triparma columacea]